MIMPEQTCRVLFTKVKSTLNRSGVFFSYGIMPTSLTKRSMFTLLASALIFSGQGASQQQQRVIGVVMEKQGSGAKIRSDAGDIYSVVFAPDTKFQKIAPGETSLKNAQSITIGDLNDGDRVLARGTATDAKTVVAQSIVVMSKTDLAQKQQKEQSEWRTRGVSGTVTAVDAGKKEITIRPPSLGTQQLVVVTLKDNAPLRRYAQDSVRFADAKPATINDIKTGDQLRARGEKNPDGSRFEADEVVTGSFQTVAGTVVAVNEEAKEVQMKDLDSGKVVTVRLTPDSNLKRMPSFGGGGGPGGTAGQGPRGEGPRSEGPRSEGPRAGGPGMGSGRMPDIQQMLERLPQSTLAEVKPGETIIVASTKGAAADHMTAITVLAGADRLIAMRRAMAARAGGSSGGQSSGPGGNWNLGDMSMIPMP